MDAGFRKVSTLKEKNGFPAAALDSSILLAAIKASGEASLVTSAEYGNPAITRMTGYELKDIIGQTPRIFQGPDTRRDTLDRMHATLAAGETFQGEAVNYRKDGSTYMVEWLITPMRDADGRIAHWVSAQRDVTARHEAETALRESEARQAVMVAELQHRTRNLIAVVRSIASDTMNHTGPTEAFRDAFADRLSALSRVQGLLSRARKPNPSPSAPSCGWSSTPSVRAPSVSASQSPAPPSSCAHPPCKRSPWRCTSSPPTPGNTARCRTTGGASP